MEVKDDGNEVKPLYPDVPGKGQALSLPVFVGPDLICGKQGSPAVKAGGALFLGHGLRAVVLHPPAGFRAVFDPWPDVIWDCCAALTNAI